MGEFTTPEWLGISLVIIIMGMSEGGLPIAGLTLPLLVLIWPEQGEAARSAVSFMLPLLCTMDLIGVILYRGKPDWSHVKMLLPATIAGILVASLFFVSDKGISVSDQMLKLVIGLLGPQCYSPILWREFDTVAQEIRRHLLQMVCRAVDH